jgi:hypothetical protein
MIYGEEDGAIGGDMAGDSNGSSGGDDDKRRYNRYTNAAGSGASQSFGVASSADRRALKSKEEIRIKSKVRKMIVEMGHHQTWLNNIEHHVADLCPALGNVVKSCVLLREYLQKTAGGMLVEYRSVTNDLILNRNVSGSDTLDLSLRYARMAIDYLYYYLTALSVERNKLMIPTTDEDRENSGDPERRQSKKRKQHDKSELAKAREVVNQHAKKKQRCPGVLSAQHHNRVEVFKCSISKIATAYYGEYLGRLKRYTVP